MTRLLDVNVLLAAIWKDHERHADVASWLNRTSVAVCPISELGFLRISTNPKAYKASMELARKLLQEFVDERNVARISDDLPALDAQFRTSAQVTDFYLAGLAAKHGFKLATLDREIRHPAVELIDTSFI